MIIKLSDLGLLCAVDATPKSLKYQVSCEWSETAIREALHGSISSTKVSELFATDGNMIDQLSIQSNFGVDQMSRELANLGNYSLVIVQELKGSHRAVPWSSSSGQNDFIHYTRSDIAD